MRTSVSDGADHTIYGDVGGANVNGMELHMGPGYVAGGALYNLMYEQNGSNVAHGRGTTGRPLNDGIWHHVVAALDGVTGTPNNTDWVLYIDGTEPIGYYSVDTYNTANWPTNCGNFRIGQTGQAGGAPWSGNLSEVAIYSGALTAAEVKAHYAALRR